ncbi:MAG: methyltransferase domain-containing protein [Alphaproteobacteria bacterium GM7ARS4]|nr:methyltransferase domain-containing protein [Alphaproteobacteria bacterium GM7ARS4]
MRHPFDHVARRRFRERSCAHPLCYDYVSTQAAMRLYERLADVKRCFDNVLIIDARCGTLGHALSSRHPIERLVMLDESYGFSSLCAKRSKRFPMAKEQHCITACAEMLPFDACAFDVIIVNYGLHLLNDIVGALAQLRRCLAHDGLFMATMAGHGSLASLGEILIHAELACRQGASTRIMPLPRMQDCPSLLKRAGFQHHVVDEDVLTYQEDDFSRVIDILRATGEQNCLETRCRAFAPSALFRHAEQRWQESSRTLTWQLLTLTAWQH